ncbi:MAG: integrase core domain-containing protein [Anaerolineae bacterium]|jgi:transposase InsO family protein
MSTRVPLTEAEKQYIYERKQAGVGLERIAAEIGCAPMTARKWWRYQRDGTQPRSRGRPLLGILGTYPVTVRETAVAIKRAHPHWGPANVRLELQCQLALEEEALPSSARLSALFKARCPEAVQPRQRYHYRHKPPPAVTSPHQRWQIDFKEAVPLGEKDKATIYNIRDPKAALIIDSRAFVTTTPRGCRKLTADEVKDVLRAAFVEWGLPLEVQTDREDVFVGAPQCYFPSPFTLWLAGLGITHIVGRYRKPTDQAHVERTHRTLGDMVWKDTLFPTLEQLQLALDDSRHRYNHQLPAQASDCHRKPPLTVYPHAQHSGRPFHPSLEWSLFDMDRVDRYLSRFVWTRKVWSSGKVALVGHAYSLGRAYAGQTVSVQFVPISRAFRFKAKDGTVLSENPARGLDQHEIMGRIPLDVPAPFFFQLPLSLEGV